jgi:hypothetical protein
MLETGSEPDHYYTLVSAAANNSLVIRHVTASETRRDVVDDAHMRRLI